MDYFIDMQIEKIRQTIVGATKKVLLGLSGGVDSSVVGVCFTKKQSVIN